jgi:hypothetical protein
MLPVIVLVVAVLLIYGALFCLFLSYEHHLWCKYEQEDRTESGDDVDL